MYGISKEEYLHPIDGSVFRKHSISRKRILISEVSLLSPVKPSKIVAVGMNYKDHAIERGKPLPKEPLLFLKPSSAVIGPNDSIIYPEMSKRVDYEGELAVIIKKKASLLVDDVDSRLSAVVHTEGGFLAQGDRALALALVLTDQGERGLCGCCQLGEHQIARLEQVGILGDRDHPGELIRAPRVGDLDMHLNGLAVGGKDDPLSVLEHRDAVTEEAATGECGGGAG